MQELSTKQKGDISELHILAELTRLGFDVYTPFGEDSRSDLIADTGRELLKVQVKTARNIDDSKIEFNCTSTRSNYTETTEHDYKDDIDGFAVYHPKTDNMYYVPIDDAPKTSMYLRLTETKNNQDGRANMAEEYTLSEKIA
jgi:hypothetical protein